MITALAFVPSVNVFESFEASQLRLQAQLSMNHLTIWQFIIELKKVQAERDLYYEFLVGGHEPPT